MNLNKLSDLEYSLEITQCLQSYNDVSGECNQTRFAFNTMIAWFNYTTSGFKDIYKFIACVSIKTKKNKSLYFQLLMERKATIDEEQLIDYYITKLNSVR